MIDRRTLIAAGGALAAVPAFARAPKSAAFPADFIWGAATAGHQVEGNNTNSDVWFLENVKPTVFAEQSGDADNSLELWPVDLDLAKSLNLNAYRFSLEWARIEPEQGLFSIAMLDHYKNIIEGCRARGLRPLVTFNHYTTPLWFAKQGGWLNADAPQLFARFCDRAARHLGAGIDRAMTLNEPNIMPILRYVLPPQFVAGQRAMLDAAAKKAGVAKFTAGNAANPEDIDAMRANLIAGHKAAKAAIKAVRSDLPVGFTLSMFDDQAVGGNAGRDAARKELYSAWLETARDDDFMGVQNYERVLWGPNGRLPAPKGATVNAMGGEVYAPGLANAVRYAYSQTRKPIIVTEHGVSTADDMIRAALIPAALAELRKAMDEGVPVLGYCHWSLIDNFEWISGYKQQLGLVAVDRTTFKRTPKPSAAVYAAIAKRNAV
ncbi:family 1 glycosylhydrolase [Sphingomonas mollis]|uniref:Glycoside hydrolase family 1 protein n=1 Tax=Sphingomonas mollis TaxID=2795726 RepID=A0ABS0XNL3_9SPHN|nr:family 1 glycosylhydrolase [Sphingomonas sp. BT553]MBJ6121629.1 glycoside hydrolase family 1 protein [Sphingomonas sp. BT553]